MLSDIPLITRIHNLFNDDLAMENDYLRAENTVLRDLLGPKRPRLTEKHRRLLLKYGMRIKDRIADVMTIVKPETLLRWNRRMKRKKWDYSARRKNVGRPAKSPDTEQLALRFAEENIWGYDRIVGELKKLGHIASATWVRGILRKHGLPPSPHRKGLSWKKFIQSHLDCTWACDFLTEEVWSQAGLLTSYVLVFIHLRTRRVWFAGCTAHPDAIWMRQQARNFSMVVADGPSRCRFVIHDRDILFQPFDDVLKAEDLEIVKTPPKSPWCNGYAERFIRECRATLSNLILLGEGHLYRVMKAIEKHHNECRPHQGIGNAVPSDYKYPDKQAPPEDVRCRPYLGGLLNHYYVEEAGPDQHSRAA